MKRLLILVSVAAMALTTAAPAAATEPAAGDPSLLTDNLEHPLGERQAEMKHAAWEAVLRGSAVATGPNMVVNLHRERGNKFVELAFEGEDQILTLLGEFGDQQAIHTHTVPYPHGGDPGPHHNEIPQPDRSVDNSTIWVDDFSQAYYDSLLYDKDRYPSMANFYLEASSGQYSVNGYVSDWVEVPYNAAAYGSNYCGSIVCTDTWLFVNDQADEWWNALVAQQGSEAAANAWLATFDVWDRYDYDLDGDFDEPDGYIDHMQSVHAGEGEETGGGAQGEDAIWSHRWYAWYSATGPDGTGPHDFGGLRIGNSNYWIGDYTVEPENGGVGVFAHEFAHDLGLPDLYDRFGGENSTAWWSVMSQGSYGDQSMQSIGEYPTHFSSQEKLFLGFLRPEDYTVVTNETMGRYVLGPAEYNTARPQAMVVVLPDKEVTETIWEPFAGDWMYYSGKGNTIENTMTKQFALGAGPVSLSMKAKYQIESCWDYAYIEVSTDGGTTFTPIANSAESDENTFGQNDGHGITGISGQPGTPSLYCAGDLPGFEPQWIDVTADLSPYANSTVHLRFRYWTDAAVVGQGFSLDNLQITGQAVDGAETDTGWTFNGFSRNSGEVVNAFFNAYVIESRRHIGYDDSLRKGPYNFGFPDRPNWTERFRYGVGLLVWYWNFQYFEDNDVINHPGHGYLLPVDSHPAIYTWTEGTQMRPRILAYDAPFATYRVRSVTLHNPATGVAATIPSRPGVRVFDDSRDYHVDGHSSDEPTGGRYQAEWNSVIVPNTGFRFKILSMNPRRVILRLN